MSLSRFSSAQSVEIKAKIGGPEGFPSFGAVKAKIEKNASQAIVERMRTLKVRQQGERLPLMREKMALVKRIKMLE